MHRTREPSKIAKKSLENPGIRQYEFHNQNGIEQEKFRYGTHQSGKNRYYAMLATAV